MALIMANPTERDLIHMRRDSQIDLNTMMSSMKKEGHIEVAKSLKDEGLAIDLIG